MSEKMFCPFCGGELYLEVDEEAGGVGLYHATNTRCIMPDIESIDDMPIGSTLDDLIARINHRPIEATLLTRVETAEKEIERLQGHLKLIHKGISDSTRQLAKIFPSVKFIIDEVEIALKGGEG